MSEDQYDEILSELETLTKTLEWKVSGDLFGDYKDMSHVEHYQHGVLPWSIPKTTGQFLYEFFKQRTCKNILEIGTSIGYSTLWIAKAIKLQNGHIDTLEVFDKKIEVAQTFFKKAQTQNIIESHHMKAIDFLNSTNHIYDGAFLDADKSNYVEYLKILRNRLSRDAVVIMDNAVNLSHKFKNVYEYLESVKKEGVTWKLVDLDAGLLIISGLSTLG